MGSQDEVTNLRFARIEKFVVCPYCDMHIRLVDDFAEDFSFKCTKCKVVYMVPATARTGE